jgi:hypothetical protein
LQRSVEECPVANEVKILLIENWISRNPPFDVSDRLADVALTLLEDGYDAAVFCDCVHRLLVDRSNRDYVPDTCDVRQTILASNSINDRIINDMQPSLCAQPDSATGIEFHGLHETASYYRFKIGRRVSKRRFGSINPGCTGQAE